MDDNILNKTIILCSKQLLFLNEYGYIIFKEWQNKDGKNCYIGLDPVVEKKICSDNKEIILYKEKPYPNKNNLPCMYMRDISLNLNDINEMKRMLKYMEEKKDVINMKKWKTLNYERDLDDDISSIKYHHYNVNFK